MRMNRKVSIWKHVRLADGNWRYCRPVLDDKGKIAPNMVHVNSHEEKHPEGEYCICFYNPKLTWQKCGPKPADALAAAERQRAGRFPVQPRPFSLLREASGSETTLASLHKGCHAGWKR